jgi:hypothetical protein
MLEIGQPCSLKGVFSRRSWMRSEAWRPAAAARDRSPREAREVAAQALRPGCEELAVTDPAQMPGREVRPRSPKPPRWSPHWPHPRYLGRAKRATCRCRKSSRSSVHCFRLFLTMEKATRACEALRCRGIPHRRRQPQYPAASAPRVRLSAAPTNPVGVTRIELADVRGKPSTTVWPRALSASIRSRGNPCSTATSSGNH